MARQPVFRPPGIDLFGLQADRGRMQILAVFFLVFFLSGVALAQESPLDPTVFGPGFGTGYDLGLFTEALKSGRGGEAIGMLITLVVIQVRRLKVSAHIPRKYQSLFGIVASGLFALGGTLAVGGTWVTVVVNVLFATAVPLAAFKLKDDSHETVGEYRVRTEDLPSMGDDA